MLDGVVRVERNGEPLGGLRARRDVRRARPPGGRACGPRASWPSRRARSRRSTALCSSGRRSPSCPGCTGGKRPDPVLITFCGVRGSTPAPGADYVRYGGNTSCVAVAHSRGAAPVLALDAGTGLANLTGLLGGAAFAGHDPAVAPALGPQPRAAVLPRRRPGRRAGDAAAARAGGPTGRGGQAGRTGRRGRDRSGRAAARPGDVAAVLPDHARRSCGAAGSSARSRRASTRRKGSPSRPGRSRTRAAGRSATGSATAGRSSPTSPTTAPPASGRARTGSAPTMRPRSTSPATRTCSSTTPS